MGEAAGNIHACAIERPVNASAPCQHDVHARLPAVQIGNHLQRLLHPGLDDEMIVMFEDGHRHVLVIGRMACGQAPIDIHRTHEDDAPGPGQLGRLQGVQLSSGAKADVGRRCQCLGRMPCDIEHGGRLVVRKKRHDTEWVCHIDSLRSDGARFDEGLKQRRGRGFRSPGHHDALPRRRQSRRDMLADKPLPLRMSSISPLHFSASNRRRTSL